MNPSAQRSYISINGCKTRCGLVFALNRKDEEFTMNYTIADNKQFVPKAENINRIMSLFDLIIDGRGIHKRIIAEYPILLVYCCIQFMYEEFVQKYMSEEYQHFEDEIESKEYRDYKQDIIIAIKELNKKSVPKKKNDVPIDDLDEDVVGDYENFYDNEYDPTYIRKQKNKVSDVMSLFILINIIKKMNPDKYVDKYMINEVEQIKTDMIKCLKKCRVNAKHKINNLNNNELAIVKNNGEANSRVIKAGGNIGKAEMKI